MHGSHSLSITLTPISPTATRNVRVELDGFQMDEIVWLGGCKEYEKRTDGDER